ncbi:unnamed protein product [Dicrocoelium dendriticum]|nr:unnamed protein product [Dicrocoelium dendriticum]
MNGSEYIYRVAPFTKLTEMTQRVVTFLVQKFGEDRVVIVPDSNTVNPAILDTDKVYLQITYVEPYFEKHELDLRTTALQRNYMLKQFSYSIPFTPSGTPYGSLSEQFQRQIILTTDHHFPYLTSRMPVASKRFCILSPIEVVIGDISRRVQQLDEVLDVKPVDVKLLQMLLQGCIGTTVNRGPAEAAFTFLKPDLLPIHPQSVSLPGSPPILDITGYADAQNKLRVCFRRLLQSYVPVVHKVALFW